MVVLKGNERKRAKNTPPPQMGLRFSFWFVPRLKHDLLTGCLEAVQFCSSFAAVLQQFCSSFAALQVKEGSCPSDVAHCHEATSRFDWRRCLASSSMSSPSIWRPPSCRRRTDPEGGGPAFLVPSEATRNISWRRGELKGWLRGGGQRGA